MTDKMNIKALFAASTLAALDWAAYGAAKIGCAVRRRHEWVSLQTGGGYVIGHHCLHCGAYDGDMT